MKSAQEEMNRRRIDWMVKDYLTTSGKPNYNPDEEGIWMVHGEDPNRQIGGYPRRPFIGLFEGKFIDVLAYAVTAPTFYIQESEGNGGEVVRIKSTGTLVQKIISGGYNLTEAGEKYDAKRKELDDLERELGKLEE